eukprot:1393416-Amorphochlora_amoeboformis.AAC.1
MFSRLLLTSESRIWRNGPFTNGSNTLTSSPRLLVLYMVLPSGPTHIPFGSVEHPPPRQRIPRIGAKMAAAAKHANRAAAVIYDVREDRRSWGRGGGVYMFAGGKVRYGGRIQSREAKGVELQDKMVPEQISGMDM